MTAIPTSTTSTGDKTRDYKIITSFFNTMSNTKDITGTIIDLKDNGNCLVPKNHPTLGNWTERQRLTSGAVT